MWTSQFVLLNTSQITHEVWLLRASLMKAIANACGKHVQPQWCLETKQPSALPLTLLPRVLMQGLSDQGNSYPPFPWSVHKPPFTNMQHGLCFLPIIHWYLHWFSGQIYTEQSKLHQLNTVFLCAGLQRQQNVYYITLLYKILIFTEKAFEPKGYFQWSTNQCCISLVI